MKAKAIILHHSGISRDANPKQFNAINNYHKKLWNWRSELGFYGGYHYLIEPDGEVKQYRKDTEEAAHCKIWNGKSIGVCLSGNFQKEEPTEKHIMGLFKLLDSIVTRHNLTEEDVFGHYQKWPTLCPGKYLKPLIKEYREQENLVSYPELAIKEIKEVIKKYKL